VWSTRSYGQIIRRINWLPLLNAQQGLVKKKRGVRHRFPYFSSNAQIYSAFNKDSSNRGFTGKHGGWTLLGFESG
jgi:hypothetical protein